MALPGKSYVKLLISGDAIGDGFVRRGPCAQFGISTVCDRKWAPSTKSSSFHSFPILSVVCISVVLLSSTERVSGRGCGAGLLKARPGRGPRDCWSSRAACLLCSEKWLAAGPGPEDDPGRPGQGGGNEAGNEAVMPGLGAAKYVLECGAMAGAAAVSGGASTDPCWGGRCAAAVAVRRPVSTA